MRKSKARHLLFATGSKAHFHLFSQVLTSSSNLRLVLNIHEVFHRDTHTHHLGIDTVFMFIKLRSFPSALLAYLLTLTFNLHTIITYLKTTPACVLRRFIILNVCLSPFHCSEVSCVLMLQLNIMLVADNKPLFCKEVNMFISR
jgi:hypothetical protein